MTLSEETVTLDGEESPSNGGASGMAGLPALAGRGGAIPVSMAGGGMGGAGRPNVDPGDAGPSDPFIDAGDSIDSGVPVTYSISFTPVAPTALHEPSVGGDVFSRSCATGGALIGYQGTVDEPEAVTDYLRSFIPICGLVDISSTNPAQVVVSVAESLSSVGTLPGAVEQGPFICPAGEVVVGFAGNSGGFIDHLDFHCAPLELSGSGPNLLISVAPLASVTDELGGPGGAPFAAHPCPAGSIAVGDTGRAGSSIDAFGLSCAMPVLVAD
jgi:hypothetical protein